MIGILPCKKMSSVVSMGASYTGINSMALMLLVKAMDMKLAITVHRSNNPLRVKPGEKKDIFFLLFVFLCFWKFAEKYSLVRVASGKMKMRTLSRGVSKPYFRPILEIKIKATLTERTETPMKAQIW